MSRHGLTQKLDFSVMSRDANYSEYATKSMRTLKSRTRRHIYGVTTNLNEILNNPIPPITFYKHTLYTYKMWTRRVTTLRVVASRAAGTRAALRAFATIPCNDPLVLMRESFVKRGMCDSLGLRMPDVHWTMSVAFGDDDPEKVRQATAIVLCCFHVEADGYDGTMILHSHTVFCFPRTSDSSRQILEPSVFNAYPSWARTLS